MNKKLLLPILGLTLTGAVTVGVVSHGVYATEPQVRTYIVDYFKNFQREEFTLSNGQKGKGNNLLYLSVEAKEYCLLEKPEDPVSDGVVLAAAGDRLVEELPERVLARYRQVAPRDTRRDRLRERRL